MARLITAQGTKVEAATEAVATVRETPVEVDERGFMTDPTHWTPGAALFLARRQGIRGWPRELSSNHWRLIDFMRNYYQGTGNVPSLWYTCRALGLTKKHFSRLFPGGMMSVRRMSGLPGPRKAASKRERWLVTRNWWAILTNAATPSGNTHRSHSAAVGRKILREKDTEMIETVAPVLRSTLESYPREATSVDSRTVTLRLMEKSDRDRIVDLARSLPPDDLLFLRRDITDPEVVDEWVREIERGRTVTVLAEKDDELLAYGSLLLHETFWGRHMGEIRVLVRPDYRGVGLGLQLASDVFAIAKEARIEQLMARMTTKQERTRARLERLGFKADAVLRGFALDREGNRRDLLVMSAGVGRLMDTVQDGLWRRP